MAKRARRETLGSMLFLSYGDIDLPGGYRYRQPTPGTTSPRHPDDTTGDQMRYGLQAGRVGRIFGLPLIVSDPEGDRLVADRMEHDA